jgi:hypothetical protein
VDLNHRPLGYEPNELPDCSTPRKNDNNLTMQRQTWARGVKRISRHYFQAPGLVEEGCTLVEFQFM